MIRTIAPGWAAAIVAMVIAADVYAQEPPPQGGIDFEGVIAAARATGGPQRGRPTQFRDFNEVTRGAEKIDGLFTLHKTGDHLYAEIRPDQFNQTLLVPITIARGLASAGIPIGDDETVLIFRRVGDRVQLVRRNAHYTAPGGTPIDKSVKQNYTDSILMALPVISMNPMKGSVLIDFSDIFMTDFAELNLGMLDRSRSQWSKVKGFHDNMELELEATFASGRRGYGSGGVADHRGVTVVIHYSLMKTPDFGYRTRTADDRVGHFLSATKDFGITDADSNFVRMINRWRLEKANPAAKLSPPKKQIVWYVEDTVPIEYRPYVEEGIREWNKAFEKIGFKDAIAVRWEESGRDEFDPEDTHYCTFRWVTSEMGGAMSCLRANPLTGEMIDGDVVFDASFIRYWKQQYALLVGHTTAATGEQQTATLAIGEVVSPILASKLGYGLPQTQTLLGIDTLGKNPARMVPELRPANPEAATWEVTRNFIRGSRGFCQFQNGFQRDFGLAAIAFADGKGPDKPVPPKEGDKAAPKKPEPSPELPEEFLGQAIKHVVMHEVGHSLGLRHNFKASTMLTADQLNDTTISRVKGLVGSVMDYSPINIAPKGKKQGDYYSTTLGPYDYWAIEYAYKPITGDEATELKKIATRALSAISSTRRMKTRS